jgi:hypothetical protein
LRERRGRDSRIVRAAQEAELLAKRGRPKKNRHDGGLFLADVGIKENDSRRAQKLADIPAEKITGRRVVDTGLPAG